MKLTFKHDLKKWPMAKKKFLQTNDLRENIIQGKRIYPMKTNL